MSGAGWRARQLHRRWRLCAPFHDGSWDL